MTAADVTFQDYRLIAPDSVTPHPDNPRRGHLAAITESIRANGFYGAIVVQASTGRVIAGNHRLLAARELGLEQIPATFVDVDDQTALRILAVDNRANDLAGYDNDALLELLTTLDATETRLEGTGYSDADLDQLLNPQGPPAQTDPDDVPEPPADPVTRPRDVWLLGPHRLLCGDARDPADVARLLDGAQVNVAFTSPPYASQRKYDETSGFLPIHPDEYVDWFAPVAATVADHLAADGSWFVNIKPPADGLDTDLYVMDLVIAHVRAWGWHFATEFCWERVGVPKRVDQRFKNQFEPVYQFARGRWKMRPDEVRHPSDVVPTAAGPGVGDTNWADAQGGNGPIFGARKRKRGNSHALVALQGTNWEPGEFAGPGMAYPGNRLPTFSGSHEATGHTAAFPVGLPQFFVKAYTDPGDTIYDPFMGSGSTLLAAHVEGRVGYGMEISPAYCDVILQRFTNHTGITPTNQDTGQAWAGKRHTSETVAV